MTQSGVISYNNEKVKKKRSEIFVPLSALLTSPPQNGYSPVCPEVPTGKWILGLSALRDNGLDLSQAKPAPTDEPLVDRFQLCLGDFLISRSNTLDKVGRVALYRGGLENCSYPDLMMRFRIDPTKVDSDYLEAYLRSEHVVRYIQHHATGTSGSMKKINQATVEAIPILLLPLIAQRKIASILSTWDTAIEKTERLIAAKERRLRSYYQRLFVLSQQEVKGWRRYRASRFLKPRKELSIPTGEMPLYSLTIEDGVTPKTDRYDREFLVKDTGSKTYKVVHPGDIVYNPANLRWGAIARANISHKVVVSPIYEVLEINGDSVNPDLLAHALTCPRQIGIFATKVEGTLIERMAVKLDTFLLTELVLPTKRSDQDKVAEFLNDATRETCLLKVLKENLRTQRRGLMQKLLTGKWRVKVADTEAA